MPISHRAAFAKFRCGVAPVKIETGRFENLDVNQRLCHFCNVVEDETHVILDCSAYDDLRNNLFIKAVSVLPTFNILDANEKMKFLFTSPDMIRTCAKTCFKIRQQRNSFFYKQDKVSLRYYTRNCFKYFWVLCKFVNILRTFVAI